jgi:hypothetical protein
MRELIPENENQLNRESKKALIELKQKPDETSLYSLQLAQWSLANNLDDPDGRLTATLEEMTGWEPQNVVTFLEQNQETKEAEEPVPWGKVKNNPAELADQILLSIHDKLTLLLPNYPRRQSKV